MKTIFLCFFCLFTIGCTHQSSQENCVEIGSADSICLQKNYILYISMWIALLKLTPFCNNAFIVLELD